MNKMRLVILVILIVVLSFPVIAQKVVYGTVEDSEGLTPAAADLTFEAYITIRTGEILYKTSTGCGYNEGAATWFVNVANFTTPWAIGEVLKVDLTDVGAGSGGDRTESNSITVQLDAAGNQNAGNVSLPVQMGSIEAEASRELGVVINWETCSETDCAGFHVFRSDGEDENYKQISTAMIKAAGNTSSSRSYEFQDRTTQDGANYLYQIQEISTDGSKTMYGPIRIVGVSAIPDEFELSQNFPNPFNPITTIQYQIAEGSDVTLKIFNQLGQEVMHWVYKNKEAGYYSLTWDGTNLNGQLLSSGIYIIYMHAGDFIKIRKLTFIR